MNTWRLEAPGQTLVLAGDGGVPWAVYWGPPLPATEDLYALARAAAADVTGGMMDANAPLSLCPEAARSFPGQPGLVADRDGVALAPRFALQETQQTADRLVFALHDAACNLSLTLNLWRQGPVLCVSSALSSTVPLRLHHLAAPVLPGPQSGEILHLSGRWIGEFHPHRSPWQPGVLTREARLGRSGHEHPPLAFFLEAGAGNTQGTVFGMHYGWSGGHVMRAEELPDGRRQIQWGHATGSQGQGTEFATAPLMLAVGQGLNGCARAFQNAIRGVVRWPRATPRPVHYNCWEAVYFDHDLDTLKDIARRAADLGAERFVLDDGWFGTRDDDTSSLGDWQVDRRKWPDGLGPLISHVHALGMGFGLWVEPEMVNLDSALARAHPDWILGRADQTEGRQQRALDMARPEVRAHLFDTIGAVLGAHQIDYLKWDHNRLLPVSEAAQTDGIYRLLGDLRAAFPQVEIESCASGGGRIDAGILHHTQRVWLSDSNDALDRLRIQHDAALLLPWEVTGSHVGPRVCHTSGRVHSMSFRAWVAAQRHMGFEMDPRELTPDEAEVLTRVTHWWKDNRDWRRGADILRLDSADPALIAEQHLAADGQRFVVFAGQAAVSGQILPRPLRLTGLAPEARYRIDWVNRSDLPRLSRGPAALKSGPVTLSGAALMQHGLTLPWALPHSMMVFEGQREDAT